ncbi:MAG: hypothetical protein WEB13_09175 [Dehalococcoidia bacterium]
MRAAPRRNAPGNNRRPDRSRSCLARTVGGIGWTRSVAEIARGATRDAGLRKEDIDGLINAEGTNSLTLAGAQTGGVNGSADGPAVYDASASCRGRSA